jgi:DNA-directed RNA polymerase subunit F
MIVKGVVKEEALTIAEAKDILNEITEKEKRSDLGYEMRKMIAHSNKFARLSTRDARALVIELTKLEKMESGIAIKIADMTPTTRNEVRSIYAKERFTLTEDELDAILDIVARHI